MKVNENLAYVKYTGDIVSLGHINDQHLELEQDCNEHPSPGTDGGLRSFGLGIKFTWKLQLCAYRYKMKTTVPLSSLPEVLFLSLQEPAELKHSSAHLPLLT